ncbi:HNH endonuclease [Streptomyces sp. QH1-20]|uniref:HNH endonuclease n=1 Tax=Streptomyces sp. QH1-20 TaxID=3240934 RepID=UPI003514A16F
MKGDGVIFRGPLGDMAQAKAGAAGMDPSDLYAAAISWWSTAITPAASLSSWPEAPMTVWTSLVHSDVPGGEPVDHLLRRLIDGLGPLAVRRNVTDEERFSAAAHATRRADNAGAGTPVFLLTGSPFTSGRGDSRISTPLEGRIRMAWDGHHTMPTRGAGRFRATRRPGPPHVGALWDLSIRDWQGFLSTDAATYSRVLHFARRAAPVALRVDSASDDWRDALAAAYAWAFNTRPFLTYTTRAGLQWDAVRAAEAEWDAVLPEPHADFFVRIGDHVSRIAGTLAATERTAIHSAHIQAAWALVRRAVLDTSRLVTMEQGAVEQLVRVLDDRLGGVPAPEGDAPPLLPNVPAPRHWAPPGRNAHGGRPQADGSAVRKLKQWYQDRCQICGTVLVLPPPRHRSSEAAHIRAREDGGPDVVENLLCLCPNCHTRFDAGALVLTDDLIIIDTVAGKPGKRITLHRWHFIDPQYVRHHWTTNDPASLASAPSIPAEH